MGFIEFIHRSVDEGVIIAEVTQRHCVPKTPPLHWWQFTKLGTWNSLCYLQAVGEHLEAAQVVWASYRMISWSRLLQGCTTCLRVLSAVRLVWCFPDSLKPLDCLLSKLKELPCWLEVFGHITLSRLTFCFNLAFKELEMFISNFTLYWKP